MIDMNAHNLIIDPKQQTPHYTTHYLTHAPTMLIVLPPGSGKSYYHALNRGVDTETLAMTVLGPAVILHTIYVSIASTDSEWAPYYVLVCSLVRGVIARWPASALPNPPADAERVDFLSNSWHLPPEHPSSQRHLRAVAEDVVVASLRSSGRSHGALSIQKFLEATRPVTAQAELDTYFSAKVGMGREELEVESRGWTAGPLSTLTMGACGDGDGKADRPVMKREDVLWLREFVYRDDEVIKAWGREKVDEMKRVSELRDLHVHLMDHVVD
jgi:hypothetical protein